MEAILNMSLGEIIGFLSGVVVFLSAFIEFIPVKINPISSVLNWIGKRTNKELTDRVDDLEKKVDSLAKKQSSMDDKFAERNAINCRVRILGFSDELRRDVKHSQESFEQALSDIDEYEKYCEKHKDFKNNRTVVARTRILDAYEACMNKDAFL